MTDWSLIRSFLAVAEQGSLSSAARHLAMTQPTVGRHIQTLEDDIGEPLFRRQARGMVLTDAGERLIAPARRMRDAAADIELVSAGEDETLRGTVRITASVFTAHHHLPAILSLLRHDMRDLQIEIVASDASDNLLFREADIAIRMYRPEQLDMVTRYLGDFRLGFFASKAYLARAGMPLTAEEIVEHDLVGYDRSELLIRGMQAYGWQIERDSFAVRCDHHTVYLEYVKAGLGIGVLQTVVAGRDPDLVPVLPELPLPGLTVWLTCHSRLRHTPRVSRVWAALAEGLAGLLEPPGRLPAMPSPSIP